MTEEKKLQISIGIDTEADSLVVKFSNQIAWLSFAAEDAINFSNLIREKAEKMIAKRVINSDK